MAGFTIFLDEQDMDMIEINQYIVLDSVWVSFGGDYADYALKFNNRLDLQTFYNKIGKWLKREDTDGNVHNA